MFESSGVEETAGDIVLEVCESDGDAAEVFEAAFDRSGRAVTAGWVGEAGQDVTSSAFQDSA